MATANDRAEARAAPRHRRARWWGLLAIGALLAGYPLFVLGTTYAITLRCDLPGGRHGPRDAYRHALASAIVAYTTSPRCVEWATAVMEGAARSASHTMDAHNNRIGARLGASAASWGDMLHAVRAAVDAGNAVVAVEDFGAAPDRIAWLPAARWRERDY